MTTSHPDAAPGQGTVLDAASASARSLPFPPAHSVARTFPIDGERGRLLLAVAEGVGDPLSAEAQASEALDHLEDVVARAHADAEAALTLSQAARASDAAVARLLRQQDSVPESGVALVVALVESGMVTAIAFGRGSAYLLRNG